MQCSFSGSIAGNSRDGTLGGRAGAHLHAEELGQADGLQCPPVIKHRGTEASSKNENEAGLAYIILKLTGEDQIRLRLTQH